jgi:hypothetical protein
MYVPQKQNNQLWCPSCATTAKLSYIVQTLAQLVYVSTARIQVVKITNDCLTTLLCLITLFMHA